MRRLEDCQTAYQLESWLANLATHVENSVIDLDNPSKEFMDKYYPNNNPEPWRYMPLFHCPCGYVPNEEFEALLVEAAEDEDLALDIYTGYGNGVFEDLDEVLEAIKTFKKTGNRDYFYYTGGFEDEATYYYTSKPASVFLKKSNSSHE